MWLAGTLGALGVTSYVVRIINYFQTILNLYFHFKKKNIRYPC